VGVEPTVPFGTPDFESGAFDHSAISPAMILRGYDFFLVSNVSVLTHLCPWGGIGPSGGQHMPRFLAMGQAEVNLRAPVVDWVKAACGHEPTAGAGPVLAEVIAVTFPRNSCRMQIDGPRSFCQHGTILAPAVR
jgi:hypothetical protein